MSSDVLLRIWALVEALLILLSCCGDSLSKIGGSRVAFWIDFPQGICYLHGSSVLFTPIIVPHAMLRGLGVVRIVGMIGFLHCL